MAQDLRELLKNDTTTSASSMRTGHQARFEKKLSVALPQDNTDRNDTSKGSFVLWMKIAAAVVLTAGILWFVGKNAFAEADSNTLVSTEETAPDDKQEVLLSNISPDFAKIESRYLASVNLQLAQLEITEGNKDLIDAFMVQLSKLDAEYKRLNQEITQTGITDEMVSAMIDNLKLRVELMLKLKSKLKELKAEAEMADAIQTI